MGTGYYAGIGSRETPAEICAIFTRLAAFLESKHWTLRSGHADGADLAFERGTTTAEIYIPWPGFNGSTSQLVWNPADHSAALAAKFHPAWSRLSQGAQKLQARNCYQVLGYNLRTPVKFVVCWTPGGTGSGGTGQALRMAREYKIPVFDFGRYDNLDVAKSEFNKFYQSIIATLMEV